MTTIVGICAVASLIAVAVAAYRLGAQAERRRRGPAVALLRTALHLRMHGERAPGGTENWADWDSDAESLLRGLDRP